MTVWSTDGRCHTAGCVAAVIATTYPGLSRDEMRREEREARRRGDDPNWTEAIGRVVGLDAESAEDLFHGRNARPLLQQVAVAVVAVPERASEEGDARLVFEVRVGEHPRPVFLAWVQSSAQSAARTRSAWPRQRSGRERGYARPASGRSAAPHRAVEARSRSCPFRPGVASLVKASRACAACRHAGAEPVRVGFPPVFNRPDQTPARRACRTRSAVVSPGGIRRATRAFAKGMICVRTSSGR